MAGFLGTIGTEDFVDGQRPLSWRNMIMRQWPNGKAPLTALTSRLRSEKVDDPEFNWWTKVLPEQGGAITEMYDTQALSGARSATSGTTATTVFVKVTADTAKHFREMHQVEFRHTTDYRYRTMGQVSVVVVNGDNSYIGVRLLEAENATYPVHSADYITIIGNINPEMGEMPDPVTYLPTKYNNYTQIFRNSLAMSRTAKKTNLRTGPAYQEAKRDILEEHSIEIEKAFIFGKKSEVTGNNGMPQRTTDGLIAHITNNAPGNIFSFAYDSDYTGNTWAESGAAWLDSIMEQFFRYGDKDKAVFAGTQAVAALGVLAQQHSQINIAPGETKFGLKVTKWMTPFGDLEFITHPLFAYTEMTRRMAVVFEPDKLRYRFIDDTHYIDDSNKKNSGTLDGTKEEYLTEAGLEFHLPNTGAVLYDIGRDNQLS